MNDFRSTVLACVFLVLLCLLWVQRGGTALCPKTKAKVIPCPPAMSVICGKIQPFDVCVESTEKVFLVDVFDCEGTTESTHCVPATNDMGEALTKLCYREFYCDWDEVVGCYRFPVPFQEVYKAYYVTKKCE